MQPTLSDVRRQPMSWFSGPSGALLSGILTASSCALLVKTSGFGKDLVVASRFGTGDVLDAFAMAYLLPVMVSSIFAGVQEALIPAHADSFENGTEAAAAEMAASGLTLYAAVLGLVMLCLFGGSHFVIAHLAPGFSSEKRELTRSLFVQLLPFAWCLGISHYLNGWLNCHKRFLAAAAAPALIPLCSVVALLLFPSGGINTLVRATQIGGSLLVIVLCVALSKWGNLRLIHWKWRSDDLRKMAADSLPLLAGTMITAALPMVDTVMAGRLSPGDVSVLGYSEKICSIFFAVLATSVGTALFPFLADLAAQGKWRLLLQRLKQYTSISVLASLPVLAGICYFSHWIVELLFRRGAFVASDVDRVALVLRWHAVQLPFFIAAVLASHVVMALRAGKYMLVTTVVNICLNTGLNLLFIQWLGLAGIPLATAVVYLVSSLMLYAYILRTVKLREAKSLISTP